MRRGLLIVFEGIDGTGKTTQIKKTAGKLAAMGLEVVVTREPTDGRYGRRIREFYADRQSFSSENELRLFMEDRKEHVNKVIAPAMAGGKIVVSDRYYFSTAAYQGACGHDPEEIIRLNEKFAPVPDLVIHLVVPVSVSIHRIENLRNDSLNDFEKEANLTKVAGVFDQLKRDYIKRVDATGDVAVVNKKIMAHVMELLGRKIPERAMISPF